MPDGQVLEFSGLTKRFGAVTAVDGLSARVEPGAVTGFLGPNGAGKTTSLRILLGLVRASEGRATIGGSPYAALARPLQTVGAVLEASSFHPGRSAAHHLAVYAQAAGLPRSRVDEALGLVGLADVGGRKVGGFSLGMRQRLGLAYALLGDPGVLVLDEPSNGLDPEGIRWMRSLLRHLAAEGRTVLISSHLLAEVQQSVDALIIIANGRLVFQGGIEDLADPDDFATVVDAPDRGALVAALEGAGLAFEVLRNGLTVRNAEPVDVGAVAAAAGIALSTLQRRGQGLEDVFLDLVNGVRVHPSAGGAPLPARADDAPDAGGTDSADASTDAADPADGPAPATDTDAAAGGDAGTDLELVADAARAPAEPAAPTSAPPEPATPTASFAVASTGVIDIVPAETDVQTPDDDDAWLADRSPLAPEPENADIVAPDVPADLAENAPEAHPEQAPVLAWAPEPTSAAEHLAESGDGPPHTDDAPADRRDDERHDGGAR